MFRRLTVRQARIPGIRPGLEIRQNSALSVLARETQPIPENAWRIPAGDQGPALLTEGLAAGEFRLNPDPRELLLEERDHLPDDDGARFAATPCNGS
ncbi:MULTISPECIES: hypothetical protein [unclassified Streptomyces]|uniref:hypothetical protein n=1 Tax=unclassified Streptomyces TaxID=2593676 RepID=UPI000F74916B|nr:MULTISPECIES: hypothetical protein [unclassified Streptomyces]